MNSIANLTTICYTLYIGLGMAGRGEAGSGLARCGEARQGMTYKPWRGNKDRWLNIIRPRILKRDDYICRVCVSSECTGNDETELIVHHIVMRSRGGKDNDNNLITCCNSCHAEIHPWLKKELINIPRSLGPNGFRVL